MKYQHLFIIPLILIYISCNEIKYTQGERIYKAECANCHMDDGSGLKNMIPALRNSSYILNDKYKIISIIHYGVNADSLGNTEHYMPSHKKMKDVELTNLLNYLQEKFNSSSFEFKLEEVQREREKIIFK